METKNIKVSVADPSALGLFGLAIVTLVASSQKLGLTSGTALIIPWALFLGGIAQLMACVYDFKRDNVFGATAFGAFGLFWLGMATGWLITGGLIGETFAAGADIKQVGFVFIGYLIFSLIMSIGATETNKTLLIIFLLINLLFLGLSVSIFASGEIAHIGHQLAAYSELGIAIMSFYGVAGNVLNKHLGYQMVSLGKPLGIFKK